MQVITSQRLLILVLIAVSFAHFSSAAQQLVFQGKGFSVKSPAFPTSMRVYVKEPEPFGETGQYFDFRAVSMSEISPSGLDTYETVVTYPLRPYPNFPDGLNYTSTSSSLIDPVTNGRIENINSSAVLPNGAIFGIDLYYFERGSSRFFPSVNYTHVLPPDTFKFSISLSNWTFASPTHRLESYMEFYSTAPLSLDIPDVRTEFVWNSQPGPRAGYNPGGSTSDDPCNSAKKPPLRSLDLNLLSFAEIDGRKQDLDWTGTYPRIMDGTESILNLHTVGQIFRWDFFNHSIQYDPDMTVLFSNSGEGSTEECDGEDDSNLAIIIGCTVGAVIFALVIVAVIGGTVWIVKDKVVSKRNTGSVVRF